MTSTTMDHTLLYGLRVDSELPLCQRRLDDGAADVTIRMGTQIPATEEPPAGTVLLDLELARRMYCATRHPDGSYTFRCHRVCDFEISADLSEVSVRMMEGGAPELAAVLATGTLLSFILAMQENTVLHASAVHVDDFAVAFVGMSGMGKSTMAALMCADGAELVTDDVLRLDLHEAGPPTCYLGATELRLRKGAHQLSSRFDEAVGIRRTRDDRQAMRLRGSRSDHLPLRGIVIPRPHHDESHTELTLELLDPMEALLTLIRFPRILGWQDPSVLGRHFHQLGEVTARTPVHVANMPWGPPFPADVAERLLEAVAPADDTAGDPA